MVVILSLACISNSFYGSNVGTTINHVACPAPVATPEPIRAEPSPAPAGECSEAELKATSDIFAAEVKRRHASTEKRQRIGYTIGEWFAAACAMRRAPALSPTRLSHVYVMIMAGSVKRARAVALRQTWTQHMPHTLMVGDVSDASIGMVTLPELYNRSGYADAQQRSLRGLLEAVKLAPADTRWVIMVDDDTWLNPLELLRFLRPLEWRLPVVLGYLFEDPGIPLYQWVGGGSGMLLSMPAARVLAKELYPSCFAAKADCNDYTLGECCWQHGIPQVRGLTVHACVRPHVTMVEACGLTA